jgi:tetratricopeptide (TPR) repeat protein
VAEFAVDIAAYQGGFATSAEDAGALKQLQLLILRHKLLATAVVALLLLVVGFTVRVMASERRARASEQDALRNEAKAHADREKDEAALARLRDTAPTFHEQALALLKENQLEAALEKIGFAVDLMPADVEFRLVQANLLQTLLRLDAAKSAYAAALRLAPTNALAQTNLAFCEHLAAQVRRGEWRGNTLTNLLATLRRQERLDEAQYLDSYLGAEQRQLVAKWTARLTEAQISISNLKVNQGLTFGLQINEFRDDTKDFAALKGMPLRSLKISGAQALRSLEPLAGMPLEKLSVIGAAFDSIEPLRGLPLVELDLSQCKWEGDLRPLAGMPLASLDLSSWRGSDLRPLAGMRIANLDLGGCPNLKDLTPLAGLPVTNLVLRDCKSVRDIAPLAQMPLQRLVLQNTAVSDLTPLQGMPLVVLDLHTSPAKSLAPLHGLKLRWLDISFASATNLSPLRGMPLEYLAAGDVKQLRDITPLAGLPLRHLYLANTTKLDLSPLATCRELEYLTLPQGSTGMEVVRRLPKLRGITYQHIRFTESTKGWLTPEEFWKAYDAGTKP